MFELYSRYFFLIFNRKTNNLTFSFFFFLHLVIKFHKKCYSGSKYYHCEYQVLKTYVDKKNFNNDSNQNKTVAVKIQSDFKTEITESSYTDQCLSSSRDKQNQLSKKAIQKDNIKECVNSIKRTFLHKITDDNIRNFYKYQFYIFSIQEMKTEWDTLMIIPECNAFLNIEVKLGPKDCGDKLELLTNASEQTQKHFFFINRLFGDMLPKTWVFVIAACVPYLEIIKDSKKPCDNCQQFILQEKDILDVEPWLKELIEIKLTKFQNDDHTVYENLVAELLYHISIKESCRFDKLILDRLTTSRETEKSLTGKVIGISGESFIPVNMLPDEHLALIEKTAGQSGESSSSKTMLTDEQQALTDKTAEQSGNSLIAEKVSSDKHLVLTGKADATSVGSDVPVYILNNEQVQAVHSTADFLIIDGDYGTGKT